MTGIQTQQKLIVEISLNSLVPQKVEGSDELGPRFGFVVRANSGPAVTGSAKDEDQLLEQIAAVITSNEFGIKAWALGDPDYVHHASK